MIDIENGLSSVTTSGTYTHQCYVCKRLSSTLDDLCEHMKKHSIYKQWIDPANVYLSNWSPEASQEILRNQPLVLVEKLDWKSLNDSSNFRLEPDVESMSQHEENSDLPFDLADLTDLFPIEVTLDQKEIYDLVDDLTTSVNDHTNENGTSIQEPTSTESADYSNLGIGAVRHSTDFSALCSNESIVGDAMKPIYISSDSDDDDDVVIISGTFNMRKCKK